MQRRHFFPRSCGVVLWVCAVALSATEAPKTIREPAVAGLFYPRDRETLAEEIDRYLAAAKSERAGELRALICPHAGYDYSGPVAASGFRLLRGADIRTVFVLAPSHYALLSAASVSNADVFRTPLGDVPVSPKARQLAQTRPYALEPRCAVEEPPWALQSSRSPPPRGRARADTWEHADEVEVPFLQRTLGRFDLAPVVFGDVDPAAAARALEPLLDDRTLIVASSDLSHYRSYAEATRVDRTCIDAICALDLDKMAGEEACGRIPILTLMHVAKQRGWKPVLLDYRNSSDTAGDKARVVGYAAVAFYAPPETLAPAQHELLLDLARRTLRSVATTGRVPDPRDDSVAPPLAVPKACFVTLTKGGELRGCIGHLSAQMPLYRAVIENTRNAAMRDPRFPPVTASEVDELAIEISVLTEPEPLAFSSPDDLLRKLQPHRDGVVLRVDGHTATYLPQVWEQVPDKAAFLDSLAEKAGMPASSWRKPGAAIAIYHVDSFQENAR
jgi:AmmeMemoRadiSam system protein B/AmmeMemoRadiSam system protein A